MTSGGLKETQSEKEVSSTLFMSFFLAQFEGPMVEAVAVDNPKPFIAASFCQPGIHK